MLENERRDRTMGKNWYQGKILQKMRDYFMF